ncbi:MAG TPA: hypothetical protein VKK81_15570 [Candidatus Binatia bacterium]|nr:hypothetical protein [Candidatus Binatia bacterium]
MPQRLLTFPRVLEGAARGTRPTPFQHGRAPSARYSPSGLERCGALA